MSTPPLRPAGASSPKDVVDAFGKLAFDLPGTKRIVRASASERKEKG